MRYLLTLFALGLLLWAAGLDAEPTPPEAIKPASALQPDPGCDAPCPSPCDSLRAHDPTHEPIHA